MNKIGSICSEKLRTKPQCNKQSKMESVDTIQLTTHGYTPEKFLGKGGFGCCILVHSEKYDTQFACKIVSKQRKDPENDDFEEMPLLEESKIIRELMHPGVLKIFDFWENSNEQYIVMEFCPNKSAQHIIHTKGRVSRNTLKKYARQLIKALLYIHSHGIAHHDLKPENFLIDAYDNIKIADFGLAKKYNFGELTNRKCGTFKYLAPETFNSEPYNPFLADIWALGVSLYQMTYGRFPWEANNRQELAKAQRHGVVFDYSAPETIVNLMKDCLIDDPKSRKNIYELQYHVDLILARELPPLRSVKRTNSYQPKEIKNMQKSAPHFGLVSIVGKPQIPSAMSRPNKVILSLRQKAKENRKTNEY